MITNISEIKARADIVGIIEQYLPLKRAGANYQANCPFHNEKSASFIVSPAKQIFTCFGCGKSGDVFKFVQEYKQLDFKEAIEEVAEISGITPIYDKKGAPKQDKKSLFTKYESLMQLAKNSLLANAQVSNYCFNRGLTKEDLEYFSIGYAPTKEEILSIFTLKEALDLGLLKQSQTRGSYTPFAHRILFALRDQTHHIVGLSGRTHPYINFKNAPKYYNSSESFLFKKSECLYLYSFAKSHIKNTQEAIICEGYLDAITLHKLGFKNAIATSGTAFNLNHINAIYKIDNEVSFTLFFDNDEAGEKAQIRAIDALFKQKIYSISCLLLDKTHKDINEFYTKELLDLNQEAREQGLSKGLKKISALKFYIYYHFKKAKSPKEKDNLLFYLKDLVKNETAFFQKQSLIEQISTITKIDPSFFYSAPIIQHTPKDERFNALAYAIFNNKECAYIAQNTDLDFLNKELKEAVQSFLQTKEIPQNALKIALDESLNIFDVDSFYKELLNAQIYHLKSKFAVARIKKDIPLLCALNISIQEKQQELQTMEIF
ncbi:DNA primase [Helicobacter himalayensis]|uniref:DNA primase n=1 Tax=Helicobacter himalayensis TaxID=1591088 RepID=UPI00082BAEB4|nr:DNA primase [Helicobacter himalayensis]